MKREDKFMISRAPYAIRHDTFLVKEKFPTYTNPDGSSRRGEKPYYTMTVEAVWFRRKSGILSAHYGHLWDSSNEPPADLLAWIENDWDGRYGGNCVARWDGESWWGGVTWRRQQELQPLLDDMLKNFPAAPEGYDGWWSYQRPKEWKP
jgi:hypothetical protein